MSNDKRFRYIMVKYMIGQYEAGKNIWTVMKWAMIFMYCEVQKKNQTLEQ